MVFHPWFSLLSLQNWSIVYLTSHHFGRIGVAAPCPATVVHSRTYHRLTAPFTTYGSVRANFSATSEDLPLNSNTAPSNGLAKAPAKTSSPRSLASHACLRCDSLNSARLET